MNVVHDRINIRPDPVDRGFLFEAGLFGINMEVTRKGFFRGICAQMLNNRKLFMGADAPDGWECTNAVRVTDRPQDSLCGSNYVILKNGGSLRQSSDLIAFQAGRQYEARAWVKALSNTAAVTFGASGAEQRFLLNADGAQYRELAFVFDGADASGGTFRIGAEGEADVFELSLLPTDHFHGMRRDVIEALREIGPTAIRYPGGCYADHFEWRESLKAPEFRKPVDGRSKPFMLRDSCHQDCVEIGLNEFILLARELGAAPEYTVSHLKSDGEDARCLIEYCNGAADTEYGAQREALGFGPFGIKVWYIGNESYYSGGPYRLDGGLAAERTNEIVHAMRRVDPDIKPVIGLVSDEHLQPWSQAFMARLDCPYAYVSHHWYYGTGPTAEPNGEAACEYVKHAYLHDTDAGLEFYKNELLADVWDTVRICVDEWNFCWGSGSNNALLISNALQLHFFARTADKYHIREARFFMPVNEGMITVTPTACRVESSGALFRLMAGHKGGSVVNCAADDRLDVLCTRHGGYYYVSVINRSGAPVALAAEGYEVTECVGLAVADFSCFSNDYALAVQSAADVGPYGILFFKLKEK